ncbi:family 20 glycosylhydrolase [Aquimarina hainanensis]|uniref:beta-N-acetylhexosaminidase n=1 Tax=Aquimarina hainanensis TaxID=1578017 RepID=A0ABW5N345_9FLAO
MNSKFFIFFFILLTACTEKPKNIVSNDHVGITPTPLQLEKNEAFFLLSQNTSISCNSDESTTIANFFTKKLKEFTGLSLEVHKDTQKKNTIRLIIDAELSLDSEAYQLHVSQETIEIKGATPQGVFYGLQSLLQLIPRSAKEITNTENTIWKIPGITITDKPAFSWRGMHLDVSRHFSSIDFIKEQLDLLSLFKINKFHWHLTDDQGWRIEIKKYPKLTEISSNRVNEDGTTYGGFYTQEQIKEVVAYAKERFIDVVPEFDIPGHTVAVLAAYPELACDDKTYKTRTLWGVESNVLCPGKPETLVFVEDVIKEMVSLFPFEYFHVGGDEVPKDQWKKSEECQQLMKKEGLKDEHELQSYFMAKVENILKKYDRKMIGWDEILEGGITPTTNIMSWQGEEGGIKAANEGHDVIMTPAAFVYFNFYQGDYKVEPMAFGGYIPLEKAYNYSPIPSKIDTDKRKHILGAQGNIWTEYASTEAQIEYLIYPRIIALAEVTWSDPSNKNFENFLTRLDHLYPILDAYEINYHIPLPEGPSTDQIKFADSTSISFTTTHPVKMVYTTDGTTPDKNSKEYTAPLTFTTNTTIKIASILPHGKMSPTRTITLEKQQAFEPIAVDSPKKGLKMNTIKGHFKDVNEIDKNLPIESTTVDSISQANTTYAWGSDVLKENFRAVYLDGYIDLPEDGTYIFNSVQDQVWIADQLVIDNKRPVKKGDQPIDGYIILKKGKHKLKIVYLNNVVKGWASDWNDVKLQYKKASDSTYTTVDRNMIFH